MINRKHLLFFILNIVVVVITSKLLPYILHTQERKVERVILVYFILSLIVFLLMIKKIEKNANEQK
ncbi:MAG: hypothetical protein K6357_01960 [Elusimicrobiota bacterium]